MTRHDAAGSPGRKRKECWNETHPQRKGLQVYILIIMLLDQHKANKEHLPSTHLLYLFHPYPDILL